MKEEVEEKWKKSGGNVEEKWRKNDDETKTEKNGNGGLLMV